MTDINKKPLEEKVQSPQKEIQSSVPKFIPAQEPKKDVKKIILTSLGLLSFFVLGVAGVLISQKQFSDDSITAPNAPKSRPAAYIENDSCHISFTVTGATTPTPAILECGQLYCYEESDCEEGLTCIRTSYGDGFCSKPEYIEACYENPSVESCCEEPAPTPEPSECGFTPCLENTDCYEDLICITADDGEGYCSVERFEEACAINPSIETCCEEPTPTDEPTSTPTEGGSSSSYSESNSSAVVNITNKNTTAEESESKTIEKTTTTTTKGDQPEYPEELPQSGPEDWIQYLQIGLGTLGIGALLILFL
jgi:hypothetical protein